MPTAGGDIGAGAEAVKHGSAAAARASADPFRGDARRERRGPPGSISAPAAGPSAKRLRLNLASCERNRAYPYRGLRPDAAFDTKAPSIAAPERGCGCARRPGQGTAPAASHLPWGGLTLTPKLPGISGDLTSSVGAMLTR